MGVGVVVVAGGTSRRWGGIDKTAAVLAGRPVLAHVLDAVAQSPALRDAPVVVVAPPGHLAQGQSPAAWVMEDPPGGGPVAGLAAGLAELVAGPLPDPQGAASEVAASEVGAAPEVAASVVVVVVLAGDLPFAAPAVPRLLAALDAAPDVDAAVGTDPGGRQQPLLAAYRRRPLEQALDGDPQGRSLRSVLAALTVVEVPVSDEEAFDLDTPQSLVRAEEYLRRRPW